MQLQLIANLFIDISSYLCVFNNFKPIAFKKYESNFDAGRFCCFYFELLQSLLRLVPMFFK